MGRDIDRDGIWRKSPETGERTLAILRGGRGFIELTYKLLQCKPNTLYKLTYCA